MSKPTEYIVSMRQIVDTVKFGLQQTIADPSILEQMMKPIVYELETVLEDDCEEMTEEMWSAMMV